MNFKKEYEKAFSDISASDDFKKQLVAEMNRGKKVRSFPIRAVGVVAAAAALVLVVGAVYMTGVSSKTDKNGTGESLVASESHSTPENEAMQESTATKPDAKWDGESQVLAQGDSENTYPQFQIGDLAWFGDARSDAEKVLKFKELAGTDAVQEVYASTEQVFTAENLADSAAYVRVAERVGEPVADTAVDAETIRYYKVVLADNKTIVFEVWDESYLKIAGVETVYQLCR